MPKRRWENNIKTDNQETEMGAWNGLIRLRTGERGGFLHRQQPNFGFREMWGIF
jgi:hypothetical protein